MPFSFYIEYLKLNIQYLLLNGEKKIRYDAIYQGGMGHMSLMVWIEVHNI